MNTHQQLPLAFGAAPEPDPMPEAAPKRSAPQGPHPIEGSEYDPEIWTDAFETIYATAETDEMAEKRRRKNREAYGQLRAGKTDLPRLDDSEIDDRFDIPVIPPDQMSKFVREIGKRPRMRILVLQAGRMGEAAMSGTQVTRALWEISQSPEWRRGPERFEFAADFLALDAEYAANMQAALKEG